MSWCYLEAWISVNHNKSVSCTLLRGHWHPLGGLLTDLPGAPGLREAVPHLSDHILKIRKLYKLSSIYEEEAKQLTWCALARSPCSAFLKLFWGWAAGAGSWRLSSKIHQIKQEIFMLIICLKHWLECVRWWQRSSWLAMWVQPALRVLGEIIYDDFTILFITQMLKDRQKCIILRAAGLIDRVISHQTQDFANENV